MAQRSSRRLFLRGSLAVAGLGLLPGCGMLPPQAQQPARPRRIGLLSTYALDPSPEADAFREGLREIGWIEGQNVAIQARSGATTGEGLAAGAAALVDSEVDVIVTVGYDATRAARDASQSVPIVMAISDDPVREGFVTSLGRPGGNVTGFTSLAVELFGKRLELLKCAVPGLSRVAVMWGSGGGGGGPAIYLSQLQAMAAPLAVQLQLLPVNYSLVAGAFQAAASGGADGVIMVGEPAAISLFDYRVVSYAAQHRLPTIYDRGYFVKSGGLMAYGPNLSDLYRRAATHYVGRILQGANPADLPVERPRTFDVAFNLKTAQALGLAIPRCMLDQVTEVIE